MNLSLFIFFDLPTRFFEKKIRKPINKKNALSGMANLHVNRKKVVNKVQ